MHVLQHSEAFIHFREDGDPNGVPVVFANSLGTDLRLWDDTLRHLPDGLRLIRFDKRGHGLSSYPSDRTSIDQLAQDACALLDHLEVQNSLFVGLSIGGMIGQSVAAQRPDLIKAMVLSNSAARMGNPDTWQERIAAIQSGGIEVLADAILERWFGPEFHSQPEAKLWRAMLTRTPVSGYIACCRAIGAADLTVSTRALRLPVLGIGGSEDQASPSALVSETTAMIPGSAFIEIAGAGHLPCVEQPKLFADLITGFLKENFYA